jgi:cytoskeleton protein RodZ
MSVEQGEVLAAEPTSLAAPPSPLTPGQALRAARERQGLTLQQIADELHLDMRMARAIEADDFFVLGVPVYARGYLRKYAPLVGLAPDEVIELYQRLTDVPAAPVVAPVATAYQPVQRISLRKPLLIAGAIAGAALVIWIGLLVFDYVSKMRSSPSPAAEVVVPSASVEPASAPVAPTSVPLSSSAEVAIAAPVAAAVEQAAPPASDAVGLRLQFSGASWVEVYDASNRRLLYDIGQAGQSRTVAGLPPLRVTLGVASAVTVAVNDRSIVVPRKAGRDAARFSVMADGTVR